MGELYHIKASKGCGNGVFAKRAIPAGTTVMTDPVALIIRKDPPKVTEADVQRAFDSLGTDKKERFLQLHEGHRPYKSKLFRIYKANAFGEHGCGKLFLQISRINHSCVPNAEMDESADCPRVIAIKPIKKGEEIFITYNIKFDSMTRQQRAGVLKAYYGFVCICAACNLTPRAQHLSDWRRTINHVLSSKLRGQQPPDLRMVEALATMTQAQAEAPGVLNGVRTLPLPQPLNESQTLAYNFMYAGLLEAEGLQGHQVARCYATAAELLALQMDRNQSICIMPSVNIVKSWQGKALAAMACARGKCSEEYKSLEQMSSFMAESNVLGSGIRFLQSPQMRHAFAVRMGEIVNGGLHVEKFTEKEYKDLIRKGQRPGRK